MYPLLCPITANYHPIKISIKPLSSVKYTIIIINIIPYSAKLWRGNFWHFWCFPTRPSNFLKTMQHLQVYGERQWASVKINIWRVSIRQNFPPSEFCAIWYYRVTGKSYQYSQTKHSESTVHCRESSWFNQNIKIDKIQCVNVPLEYFKVHCIATNIGII